MDKKVEFTMRFFKDLINRCITAIENAPKDSPLDSDFSTSYLDEIDRFDLPTVKGIAARYDNSQREYRIEISILFQNNVNIDKDYLVLEVWEKCDEGNGKNN